MAFDRLEVVVSGSAKNMPASVSLNLIGRGGGRPRCFVGLNAEICAEAKLKATDTFDVMLGRGEHAGQMRFQRSKTGIVSPRITKGGGAMFNLGHIARFGTEPEKKQFVSAEVLDRDTIAVVLPKWAGEPEV